MPVVDIHPHIVSPDTDRYPLAPLGGTQSAWSSERPTTYETLLKEMDAAGVDKAAIVHSSTAYGYDNSYVADAVAAVPSRFTGVYSIDVLAPDAVKTFDAWLMRGCSGMRLFTTGSTLPDQAKWFVDPKTHPFWEHAAAKNIPVCMQMKAEGIPLLRQIMDRFPKVTIILDHLACRRSALCGGRRTLRPCQIPAALFESHADQRHAQELGQSYAGKSFRQGDRHIRCRTHWLGFEFSQLARHAFRDSWRRAEGIFVRQGIGPGLDLRQNRASSLSQSGRTIELRAYFEARHPEVRAERASKDER